MTDYVTFECEHMKKTDLGDADEVNAAAYMDIDGYSDKEDAQGTVICRVWLLWGKTGMYHTYLVDWHHNGYRTNETVRLLIDKAKKDLDEFFERCIVGDVFNVAYHRYQLQWMMDHGKTVPDLVKEMDAQMEKGAMTAKDAFDAYLNSVAFSGNCWSDEDEFRETCWKDEGYMRNLLTGKEYRVWQNR